MRCGCWRGRFRAALFGGYGWHCALIWQEMLAQGFPGRHASCMRRILWVIGLSAALSSPVAAGTNLSVFGGFLTDNPWEEVLLMPWKMKPQRPGFIGLAISHPIGPEFRTPVGDLRFELEAQLVLHAGLQQHWEVNLPLTARLVPERPVLGVIDTVAFGIGPSFASRPPSFEKVRGNGTVARNLVYMHLEIEHQFADGGSVFGRVHHRSDAFGLIGPGASSNALVIGHRWGF